MHPVSKILVPTDFSEAAGQSLRYALELAHELDATVLLLHVYEIPTYPIPDGGAAFMHPEAVAEFLTKIDDALARTKSELGDDSVPLEVRAVEGRPAQEIIRIAEEERFDAIVIGTHGRTALSHLLMGSVAEQVVRSAACPVITVHPTQEAAATAAP